MTTGEVVTSIGGTTPRVLARRVANVDQALYTK